MAGAGDARQTDGFRPDELRTPLEHGKTDIGSVWQGTLLEAEHIGSLLIENFVIF